MDPELIVKPDAAAVAQAAAARIVAWAGAAVATRGRFRVALSGGGTPDLLYRLLADQPGDYPVPWQQTQVFWGDERHLPPGHTGRNDTTVLPLLARLGVPADNIHPVPYVPGDLQAAAAAYEATLRGQVRVGEPLLDLVLLGLGTDGHTASLFPGTPALDVRGRLVASNRGAYEDRFPDRVTLTVPAINAAAAVMFLVTGAGKRAVLAQVLAGHTPPLPAQRIQPVAGRLLWLVDRAADPETA